MSDKAPEPDESLSATGMFLRALQAAPLQAVVEAQPDAHREAQGEEYVHAPRRLEPSQPSAPSPSEAGEFTRMFRAVPDPAPVRATPEPPQQASPKPASPETPQAPATADGEFTRSFVLPTTGASAAFPPAPGPAPPAKARGFSTPGMSDSASDQGSFTRVFRPPPPPESSYTPRPQAFARNERETGPSSDSSVFPSQPNTPSPPNFTSIFSALSNDGEPAAPRSAHVEHHPTNSVGTYLPPPPPPPVSSSPTPGTSLGGGITQLINLLSEGPSAPGSMPGSPPAFTTHPAPPTVERPAVSAEEEFLRVTQPSSNAPLAAVSPPPPLPAAAQSVMAPPIIVVPPLQPAAAPKLPAPPKLPVASLTLPAVPKTKLQEIVPLLLVANAFLMLILIVLVVFLLSRK